MADQPLIKINATTAAEVCARFGLKQDTKPLLRDGASPREFVEALAAKEQYIAGIDFMAHALPPREAIWWGCLCLQHACGDSLSAEDKAAARAAVRWVFEPSEASRAATRAPAEAAGAASPAGALAAAAYQTGGNVAPPKAPPAPFAPAKSVAIAIKVATTKAGPLRIMETQRLFMELGVGIAEGHFM